MKSPYDKTVAFDSTRQSTNRSQKRFAAKKWENPNLFVASLVVGLKD